MFSRQNLKITYVDGKCRLHHFPDKHWSELNFYFCWFWLHRHIMAKHSNEQSSSFLSTLFPLSGHCNLYGFATICFPSFEEICYWQFLILYNSSRFILNHFDFWVSFSDRRPPPLGGWVDLWCRLFVNFETPGLDWRRRLRFVKSSIWVVCNYVLESRIWTHDDDKPCQTMFDCL